MTALDCKPAKASLCWPRAGRRRLYGGAVLPAVSPLSGAGIYRRAATCCPPLQRGPLCQRSKRVIKLRIIVLYLLAREMLLKTCSEQYGGFETVQQIFSFPFKVYRPTTRALMMPSNFVWRKPTRQRRAAQRPKFETAQFGKKSSLYKQPLRFSYQLQLNLWIQYRKNWYVISCQNSYLFQIYLKNFIGHNFKPCWCWSSAKLQVNLPCSQVIPVCGFWLDLWFTVSFWGEIPVSYFSSKYFKQELSYWEIYRDRRYLLSFFYHLSTGRSSSLVIELCVYINMKTSKN